VSCPPPDLYIAQRDVAPYQKWSLHKTGDWLYQWVNSERAENRARELGHAGGRVLDRWSQPPEVPGTGWTSAFSINTRHEDLVAYDNDSQLPGMLRNDADLVVAGHGILAAATVILVLLGMLGLAVGGSRLMPAFCPSRLYGQYCDGSEIRQVHRSCWSRREVGCRLTATHW
jgi:hypothetical protein